MSPSPPNEPTDFTRLKKLFEQALSIEPAQREVWLQSACRGHTTLYRQLRDMLSTSDASFQNNPTQPPPSVASSGQATSHFIGPYRLLRELGRGGMGVVYLAVRDDGAFRKNVALKVLLGEIVSPEFIQRFKQERQVVAALDHTNIARILDGGDAPSGMPYYVMEYVEGLPIDKYCDEYQLSLTNRIKLFQQVCKAVHYLHQNLIIHRDLKPSNILVPSDGAIKLLDFGIAKMVGAAAMSSQELTGIQGRPMTPVYASPEQIQGATLQPASDIYSLGVILYKLLTGRTPYHSLDQKVEKLASREEPPLPSANIREDLRSETETTAQLRRMMMGGLDNIVLMSMRFDPKKRYQSAAALADDLQHFIDGESMTAYHEAYAIRSMKAIKRLHRPALLVLSLLFLAGVLSASLFLLTKSGSVTSLVSQLKKVGHVLGLASRSAFTKTGLALAFICFLLIFAPFLKRHLDLLRVLFLKSTTADNRSPEQSPAPNQTSSISAVNPLAAHATTSNREQLQRSTTVLTTFLDEGMSAGLFTESISSPGQESSQRATSTFTELLNAATPTLPEAHITITECPDRFLVGQVFPIKCTPFSIGRAADNLSVSSDLTLSRNHARVDWDGCTFTICDLNSSNGTFLDGRSLRANQSQQLPYSSEIRLSKTTILRFFCPLSELPDFTGQVLADNYELVSRIRTSRKTVLYEAKERALPRKVAIKLLSPTLSPANQYQSEFTQEARIAGLISHPNICQILSFGRKPLQYENGEVKDIDFLVMEWLDGGDLTDKRADMSIANILRWLEIVAGALDDIHKDGVVHGGIKPTSLVFSSSRQPYLTDFASAICPETGRDKPFLGATDYVAPEQWDGYSASAATDQYSLAAVVYWCLTGSVPFLGQRDPSIRARNLVEGPPPAHTRAHINGRSEVPPAVSEVLKRALSAHPEERYTSVEEFAKWFKKALQTSSIKRPETTLFISYRRSVSSGWPIFLQTRLLEKYGIRAFVDTQNSDGAGRVSLKVQTAIRTSDFFICLLSRTTFASKWVLEEIEIAAQAGKLMVPIFTENFRRPDASTLPASVNTLLDYEGVRLFSDYGDEAVEKLAQILKLK